MKFGSSILIFLLAFTSASLISELNADFVQDCKDLVDTVVVDFITNFMEKDEITAMAWEIFGCLQDAELFDDMKALCTIVGRLLPSTTPARSQAITQMTMFGNYFIQEQAFSLCDLCDNVNAQFSSLSEKDMETTLNWVSTRIPDPKLALAVKQHGPKMINQMIQAVLPAKICNYLKNYCKRVDEGIVPIVDTLKEAFRNATPCVECNLCHNALLYLEMHVLPNPLLPGCITKEIEEKICVLLKDKVIFDFDLYPLCLAGIEKYGGTFVEATKTLIHPNLLCGWACDADHNDNMIQCVCDHVRLPNFVDWLLPCAWQRDKS